MPPPLPPLSTAWKPPLDRTASDRTASPTPSSSSGVAPLEQAGQDLSNGDRIPRTRMLTWPMLGVLVALVGHGTAEKLHARLLQWGQSHWPGYARLRQDVSPPRCTLDAAPSAAAPTPDSDLLDQVLPETSPAARNANPDAAYAAQQACLEQEADHARLHALMTPGLRLFRQIETHVAAAYAWGTRAMRHILVGMLLWGACMATLGRNHIALRAPSSSGHVRLAALVQGVAVLLAAASWGVLWYRTSSGLPFHEAALQMLWWIGLTAWAGVCVGQVGHPGLCNPPVRKRMGGLLSIPLYSILLILAAAYFGLVERHPAGLAIYLHQLTEHALLYTPVGLYVWVGMLLKETRLTERIFAILRPWRLRPETLAFVLGSAAALPTAYSGASGIFVMAAGALIYQELKHTGASDGLALAATAMSGSLGVVLSPCLLVVIAAALNKQVTTSELYGWGRWVFALTASLYGLACGWLGRRSSHVAVDPSLAWKLSRRQLGKLVPYGMVFAGVLLGYRAILGTTLNEHTAPVILPVILLAMLLWERWHTASSIDPQPAWFSLRRRVLRATFHTSGHLGALLTLMAASLCMGGVIQRSNVMTWIPTTFASPLTAMATLVAVLVGVGMCMDPYGAVILVSASIAQIAYRNGIHPVHFWMVVLVAFELGYLTPPVALNHLLARRVAVSHPGIPGRDMPTPPWGASRATGPMGLTGSSGPAGSFGQRHLDMLLPLGVMGCALLLVAFVPLFW